MKYTDFNQQLTRTAKQLGACSAACIRIDNRLLQQQIEDNNRVVADWLEQGQQGEMAYLERMFSAKAAPWKTYPFARSVIVLTFDNRWGDPAATHRFPAPAADAPVAYLSAYVREKDYHQTGRTILESLAEKLNLQGQSEAVVDTGAVYERLLAKVGGLGIKGANDLLLVPGLGCRVFIGCLFVEEELPEVICQQQASFSCDNCLACLNNCPTGAIGSGRPIDARLCISYLTIEKRGVLSCEEAISIGDWVFGCDCCTSVCPPVCEGDLRIPVDLEWLFKSSAGEIRRTIKGSAAAYAGVTQLRKNAVAVLANLKTQQAAELLRWVRQHNSSELVRKQLELLCS